jgi:iron complex transport system ATP-binding protein
MKNNQNVLITQNLAIGYPGKGDAKSILQSHLDLGLKTSELTCLLGPNGCGKSTLIRSLSGFHRALEGSIKLFDQPLSEMTPVEISKVISVTLTEPVDVGNMTVFSVVAFGRSPYTGFLGKLRNHDFEIIQKSLENAGIGHLHNRQFSQLSDGEKQKVMIAKSLAQETSLLLLDEPTAFLDFPSKIEILRLLRNTAWDHQKAILLTTHDLNLALNFADKIWLIGNEMPVVTGIPEDLILSNLFGKYFDKKTTRFDVNSGSFTFEVIEKGKVQVKGSGLKYDWLVKALKRKGFTISGQDKLSSELPKITVNHELKGTFELEFAGSVFKMNSIEELLEKLANIT